MGAAKACNSPYESARNQRIQENQKRLQELGLADLARNLTNIATTTKSSPNPRRGRPCGKKEKVKVQLRRSTRNSGRLQPEYVEVEIDVRRRARFDNTGGTRHYSRLYERKYASDEARGRATDKAEALKKELPQRNASFVKPMLQSHVTGGFWLGLPVAFCREYLPKKDDRIVLEDENNEEWETVYLSNKTGLSGGWRGFSLDHGLVDGDALVFELVERRRFKVHIIRVYGSNLSNNEEDEELEDDAKEQILKAAENGNSHKVRQRLIWETELKKDNEMEESDDYDIKPDVCHAERNGIVKETDDFDIKPDVCHAEQNGIMKEEMECSAGIDDVKNVDLLDIQVDDLLDIKVDAHHDNTDLPPFKRPRQDAGLDTDAEVKSEMQTGDEDGFEHVPLLDRYKHAKDITFFMKSKKNLDVLVKKECRLATMTATRRPRDIPWQHS